MTKAKVEVDGEGASGPPKIRYVPTFVASVGFFVLAWGALTVLLNLNPKAGFSYPDGELALRILGVIMFALLTVLSLFCVFSTWFIEADRAKRVRAREARRKSMPWSGHSGVN
jgi:hypothetical protein